MIRSLRSRLLIVTLGGIALLLALSGMFLYAAIRQALLAEVDASLGAACRTLLTTVEREHGEIETPSDHSFPLGPDGSDAPIYYQFWREDGSIAGKSPNLADRDLPRFHGLSQAFEYRSFQFGNVSAVRGVGVRVQLQFEAEHERAGKRRDEASKVGKRCRETGSGKGRGRKDHDDDEEDEDDDNDDQKRYARGAGSRQAAESTYLTLVVARGVGSLQRRLAALRRLLLAAFGGTVALGTVASMFVLNRELRPLDALSAQIGAIDANGSIIGITPPRLPSEMAPVVQKLNELLARLHERIERERALVGEIAHELRTPLAGVLATCEVALNASRSGDEYREAINDCLAISRRLHTQVESLLMMASLEAGRAATEKQTIAVAPCIDDCWQDVCNRAQQRGLAFENRLLPSMRCVADHASLTLIFSNLLGNAVEYTDEGGCIWVDGVRENGQTHIHVANTGCRLNETEAARVFERFWRGDASRSNTGAHAGLGLALVQRLVLSIGGDVTATVDNERVFTVRLTLPSG